MRFTELSQYRILSTLWHGETTVVYLALDPHGQRVTLKTLLPTAPSYWRARWRLRHEVRISRRLDHPNISRVHRLITDAAQPCLVMEYFPGRNLKARLVGNDPLVQQQMARIMWDTAQALHYLHGQSILHCDVKPANLIVGDDGATKLTDLAIAVIMSFWWKTIFLRRRLSSPGSRLYMAPETILRQPISPRTDIYSLGCTMYEMITGTPPFPADYPEELVRMQLHHEPKSPRGVNPNVDRDLEALVMQMMRKAPNDRPRSMDEVRVRLAKIRGFDAVAAKPSA